MFTKKVPSLRKALAEIPERSLIAGTQIFVVISIVVKLCGGNVRSKIAKCDCRVGTKLWSEVAAKVRDKTKARTD